MCDERPRPTHRSGRPTVCLRVALSSSVTPPPEQPHLTGIWRRRTLLHTTGPGGSVLSGRARLVAPFLLSVPLCAAVGRRGEVVCVPVPLPARDSRTTALCRHPRQCTTSPSVRCWLWAIPPLCARRCRHGGGVWSAQHDWARGGGADRGGGGHAGACGRCARGRSRQVRCTRGFDRASSVGGLANVVWRCP